MMKFIRRASFKPNSCPGIRKWFTPFKPTVSAFHSQYIPFLSLIPRLTLLRIYENILKIIEWKHSENYWMKILLWKYYSEIIKNNCLWNYWMKTFWKLWKHSENYENILKWFMKNFNLWNIMKNYFMKNS